VHLKLPAAGSRNQSNGNLNDRSVAFLWARAGADNKSADSDYLRIDDCLSNHELHYLDYFH
jgi:hypothetical protein